MCAPQVSTGFVIENERFYCVRQTVAHAASGLPLADGHLKLVFVKDGQIVKAPDATLRHLGLL